jgi:hypothetical protein
MSAPVSVPSPTPAPYQQWQTFFPPAVSSYDDILASMQNQHINQNIYNSTDKLMSGINETSQYLTAGLNNIGKEVTQSSSGLRDAVERGNLVNGNAIERTTGEIKLNTAITDATNRQAAADTARDILRAIDHNGTVNSNTTERIGSNLSTSIERNGGNIMTAIEKVAGEGRLTTTVVDAASRQAAADSARDILGSVDRNGSAAVNATNLQGANLLSTIERVAGEGRVTTTVTDAASRQAAADSARDVLGAVERTAGANNGLVSSVGSNILSAVERNGGDIRELMLNSTNTHNSSMNDVRSTIVDGLNRGFNEMLSTNTQNLNQITKAVTDSGVDNRTAIWETRTLMNLNNIEQLKASNALQMQAAQNYASSILEGQKSTALLSLDGNNHYASLMLEQQKVKEYLSSKSDSHFAMNQLEMHKMKEGLAAQAAHNFSALQLDQHKIKECLQAQLAEAKYDALKNTQFLADKMCECCCEVKQKIDLVDRDRLRDGLVVERTDNQILKIAEFLDRRGHYGRGDYGHRHGDDHRGHDDHRR